MRTGEVCDVKGGPWTKLGGYTQEMARNVSDLRSSSKTHLVTKLPMNVLDDR